MAEHDLARFVGEVCSTDELQIDPYALAHLQRDAMVAQLEMLFAGTKSYGKQVDAAVISTWTIALDNAGVLYGEFQVAVEYWITEVGGDTPEPHAIVAFIRQTREDVATRRRDRETIAREDRENEAARRARNVELYGAEEPTKEQIQDRLLGSVTLQEVAPNTYALVPRLRRILPTPRQVTADEEAQVRRVRDQARLLRALGSEAADREAIRRERGE